MLYTVNHTEWTQGSPLEADAARRVFHRSRADVRKYFPGRQILAISLCYDAVRSIVYARGNGGSPSWTAPALTDHAGRLTILAPIPASLVTAIGEPTLRVHRAGPRAVSTPPTRSSAGRLKLWAARS